MQNYMIQEEMVYFTNQPRPNERRHPEVPPLRGCLIGIHRRKPPRLRHAHRIDGQHRAY